MSYFIANNYRVVDNQLQLKGGDNNVVPRTNEWTGFFKSGFEFVVDFEGGMVQLPFNTQSNKLLILEEAFTNTKEYFRTNHNIESFYQYYKAINNEPETTVDVRQLINDKFFEMLKIAENKAKDKYILQVPDGYLFDIRRGKAFTTKNIERADKLGYFKAAKLEKTYSHVGVEMVRV